MLENNKAPIWAPDYPGALYFSNLTERERQSFSKCVK